MKRSISKALALALCGALALGLAACGGSTGSQSQPAQQSDSQNGGGGDTAPAANDGDAIEVVFWHSNGGETGEALEQIINTYNETRGKEKNIHANLIYQGYDGTDKVVLAYQTKDLENAPDINQGLTSTIPAMMDLDWTVSAQAFLDSPDTEITAEDFYPAMRRSCSYMGEMVGVPFANSIPTLYYNVDALSEAGFDSPPATFDQLIEYTEALTQRDDAGNVTRYGLNMQVKRYQLVNFVVSQSPDSFFGDNEGGRAAPMTRLTTGEDGTLEKVLNKMEALLATGGYKYVEDSPNEEFAQGLSAMAIMSSSRTATIDSLVDGAFSYMTAPMPKINADDTSGAAIGGSCLTLLDRGDQARLEAAWDVIQYCVSPESQYIFSTASGYIPVNPATEQTDEMQAYYEEHPQYLTHLEQLKASHPNAQEPMEPVYNEVNSIITNAMLEFCEGGLTVQEAIDKIVGECDDALDEYHFANG